MRVFIHPTGLHSRAMTRTANALQRYLPDGMQVTTGESDLAILHVISDDALEYAERLKLAGIRYAVIQYCVKTAGSSTFDDWYNDLWRDAECVWSYYDLSQYIPNFYYAPLGIDDCFLRHHIATPHSQPFIITSGYVSDPGAEPIAEVWQAANKCNIAAVHIGPKVVSGMVNYPSNWDAREGISDDELAELYSRATWVSALRHVEGLEMCGIEGLSCGARPIAFQQNAMMNWYGDHALYVKDQSGEALVDELCKVMANYTYPVGSKEVEQVRKRFDWASIVGGFWLKVAESMERAA